MDRARRELQTELDRLGATSAVLSTNVELRIDGNPRSDRRKPDDQGAAVYFKLDGRDVVLACDKWCRVECNVWAIAKHIESLRAQDRWGVGSVEQAFRGYMALPEKATGSDWWQVLGVPINATREQAREAYKILAKKHHPDVGGNAEYFRRVQNAWEECERLLNETK